MAATLVDLATLADVEAVLGRTVTDADERALVARLLREASAAMRTLLGQPVTRTTGALAELDSNGAEVVLLRDRGEPAYPVLAVTQVVADGVTLDPGSYEWSRSGALRRAGGWPVGYRTVQVTFDYGYDPVPDDVVLAVAEAVAARVDLGESGLASTASVDDVLALVPEAQLGQPVDAVASRAITEADVQAWIEQAAGAVQVRCSGWMALPPADRAAFKAAARGVVARGAAALLEAARFPERSGVADTSHAQWLRAQYEAGLEELASRVGAQSETGWSFGALSIEPRPARWWHW